MRSLLTITCCAGGLVAQQFATFTGRVSPELPQAAWTVVALGDSDNDGDQDAAVNGPTSFSVLRQGPNATWTTFDLLPNVITAAHWVDFDGDGDRDVLVGATGGGFPVPYGIVRNNGGVFTWLGQSPSFLPGSTNTCTTGDVNGDLLPDAVLGTTTGVQVGRNLGNAVIGNPTIVSQLPNARPELFDRDGDGDLDMVIASPSGAALLNNHLGTFTAVGSFTATGIDAACADFDGDGRIDIAFANGNTIDVLWNQPTGWLLQPAVIPNSGPAYEVLVGDLDEDGDPDLVVRSQYTVDWARNDGNHSFTRLTALRYAGLIGVSTVALGDGASRGATDVVAVFANSQVRTLYGAAPQPFHDPQIQPGPLGTNSYYPDEVALGDLDADGLVDVVSPGDREFLHNDGRGRFSRRGIPGARTNYRSGWIADFDGDGDQDLVLGNAGGTTPPYVPLQRFANDGLGNLTAVQDVALGTHSYAVRVGDVNGDGAIDMLTPAGNGQLVLILNVGNGTLVDAGLLPGLPPMASANDFVFADLDGDGDRDLLAGQSGNTLPVLHNNGQGAFSIAAALPITPGLYVWRRGAADLDGDGDMDFVINESGASVWFRNLGGGAFTRVDGAFPAGCGFSRLQFVDIDEDGDLDILTGDAPCTLVVNAGNGVFQDGSALLSAVTGLGMQIADLDEDGDVDLLTQIGSAWQRFDNRMRSALSLQRVQPGGSMQVRFFVRPQAPIANSLVLPLAALAAGPSTAFPDVRGRLLLSPASSVALPLLATPTGTATSSLAIPPAVALIGVTLHVQGLVVVPTGFELTNVVDEVVLP